ncbi:hypothetical protein EDC01DRAFT_211291 [Geopyxis carbonaria]|nr:hypothetical protein EDC01DRAFT_211291 [Geopyxis carbonaria]
MGLAGPKNKTKIGKDPRNTFWSGNTSRFGHKHLEALGWTPGDTLGDKNSTYHAAGHITDASSSGVRIHLKDDNLGIGAKRGAAEECTGLLGLQGLLGRLNGDDKVVEMVKKEESRRQDAFFSQKFGMRFVRGEVLHSDDILKLREKMVAEGTAKVVKEEIGNSEQSSASEKSEKKKRKRESREDGESSKKRPKSKSKKSKRDKSATTDDETESGKKSAETSDSEDDGKSKAKKRKDKKKAKRKDKEERKKEKKEKKRKSKKSKSSTPDSSSDSSSESEAEAAPVVPVAPVRTALTGRRAIRARYIAAKRSATMDSKSLNEILMVTA